MSDGIELVTSVRLEGETTLDTYRRELRRCLEKKCDYIMIPIVDFQGLIKVADAANKFLKTPNSCQIELEDALLSVGDT